VIDREFPMVCGPRTVWTCGRIALDPGAPSIIPGKAEVLFQFRDIERSRRWSAWRPACAQSCRR
jgi:N-carbamoyl-L-amino-acid hydrolase